MAAATIEDLTIKTESDRNFPASRAVSAMKKILLSIAGYDPTSGAGATLDLKVFHHLDFQGMAILTSLTAQNTKQVKKVQCLPPEFVWEQYRSLGQDVSISGIKVGMIGWGKNLQIIAKILAENPQIPKVVDPVFKSSSGAWLLEKKAIPAYLTAIREKASLLTPNINEATLISGIKIKSTDDIKRAARKIHSLSGIPCLLKGGHLAEKAVNLLYDGKNFYFFKKKKLKKNVHGTGCFLSSSILAFLAKGYSLKKACSLATELTYQAIKSSIRIGKGRFLISFLLKTGK
jgi:hydroxymethylpyrimidine/phosphomethylpyrimidine kinase